MYKLHICSIDRVNSVFKEFTDLRYFSLGLSHAHTHSSLEPPATKRPRPLAHPSPSPSLDLDPTPTSVMESQEQPAQTSEEVGGVAPPMDTQVTESQVSRMGRRRTNISYLFSGFSVGCCINREVFFADLSSENNLPTF